MGSSQGSCASALHQGIDTLHTPSRTPPTINDVNDPRAGYRKGMAPPVVWHCTQRTVSTPLRSDLPPFHQRLLSNSARSLCWVGLQFALGNATHMPIKLFLEVMEWALYRQ